MPFLLWRRKLYAGMKYESYDESAVSQMHSRGIALVRRDCAALVRNALRSTLNLMLQPEVNEAAVLANAVECVRLVAASARTVHNDPRPDEHLPLSDFELSGGLSKNLDEYDSLNAQGAVATRLMELFPLEKLGKGTRVTYVYRAEHAKTKRRDQATLVADLVQERCPLNVDYYTEAMLRKLCPVLSALFVEEEKRSLTHQSLGGGTAEVQHRRAAERNALVGQTTAEKRMRAALAAAARGSVKTRDENGDAPPARMLTLAAFARPAAAVAATVKKPAGGEKRKVVSGARDAFAVLMAGSTAARTAQGSGNKKAKTGSTKDRTLHAM
jgi:DNA polymerase elongation subunit (family B)